MWRIAKEFDFCYGHRVHNQELNTEYSIDTRCVCRHLHGHQGKIIVELSAPELKQGMVTDFKHLNWFKKFVDDTLDHKFIIDINDPSFADIIPRTDEAMRNMVTHSIGQEKYRTFNISKIKCNKPSTYEILEGFVVVDFVPTSENLCYWLFKIIKHKMEGLGIDVSKVQFYETPKSQANFYS